MDARTGGSDTWLGTEQVLLTDGRYLSWFAVFRYGYVRAMVSRFNQWTLDVHDVDRMATFWSAVLGYRIEAGSDGDAHLRPPTAEAGALSVWLQPTDAPKQGKNRDHPDLVVEDGDVQTEVARLVALGASHADVGQAGDEGFVVLADPEGNEFCLLHRPSSSWG